MLITCQLIEPGVGAASYTSPRRQRTTVQAFSVRNGTANPVTCSVKVNTKVVESVSLLAGASWTPSKVIRQTLEPGDVLEFAGDGVTRMASGFKQGVK
jgi:hypothetical protein